MFASTPPETASALVCAEKQSSTGKTAYNSRLAVGLPEVNADGVVAAPLPSADLSLAVKRIGVLEVSLRHANETINGLRRAVSGLEEREAENRGATARLLQRFSALEGRLRSRRRAGDPSADESGTEEEEDEEMGDQERAGRDAAESSALRAGVDQGPVVTPAVQSPPALDKETLRSAGYVVEDDTFGLLPIAFHSTYRFFCCAICQMGFPDLKKHFGRRGPHAGEFKSSFPLFPSITAKFVQQNPYDLLPSSMSATNPHPHIPGLITSSGYACSYCPYYTPEQGTMNKHKRDSHFEEGYHQAGTRDYVKVDALQRFFASKALYPWFPSVPLVAKAPKEAISPADVALLRSSGYIVDPEAFGDIPIAYLPRFQLYRCSPCAIPVRDIKRHYCKDGPHGGKFTSPHSTLTAAFTKYPEGKPYSLLPSTISASIPHPFHIPGIYASAGYRCTYCFFYATDTIPVRTHIKKKHPEVVNSTEAPGVAPVPYIQRFFAEHGEQSPYPWFPSTPPVMGAVIIPDAKISLKRKAAAISGGEVKGAAVAKRPTLAPVGTSLDLQAALAKIAVLEQRDRVVVEANKKSRAALDVMERKQAEMDGLLRRLLAGRAAPEVVSRSENVEALDMGSRSEDGEGDDTQDDDGGSFGWNDDAIGMDMDFGGGSEVVEEGKLNVDGMDFGAIPDNEWNKEADAELRPMEKLGDAGSRWMEEEYESEVEEEIEWPEDEDPIPLPPLSQKYLLPDIA